MSFLVYAATALWVIPLVAAIAARLAPRRARAIAAFATVVNLTLSGILFASGGGGARSDLTLPLAGPIRYHVGVDGLSAVLLPLTAALSLAMLIGAPRVVTDRAEAARALGRALTNQAAMMGALVALDAVVLAAFWGMSLFQLRAATRRRDRRGLSRVLGAAATLAALSFAIGALGMGLHGLRAGLSAPFDLVLLRQLPEAPPAWAGAMVFVSGLLRMGIVPLHGWIPYTAERAPVQLMVPTLATPLGSYLLARAGLAVFPALSRDLAPALIALGVLSAAYGALLAVGQHDLRRMLGYILVSQRGLILAGIASLDPRGVAGGLLHAMDAVVAIGGLLLIVVSLQARVGTVDARLLGGLVQRTPRMATGFLLLSAAAVGFPGTLGFVSEDLVVEGLLRGHGVVAVALLVVAAVNGITLYRAFKRTFLGPACEIAQGGVEDLLSRERAVALALVLLLMAGGFVPAPLLDIREGVVAALRAP